MRIISGIYKGKKFDMPSGIRPTQDKVRKAFFDTVQDWEGVSLLELYAGSGAMGLEAASRGAKEVVMVEAARASQEAIRGKLEALKASRCTLLPWEAERAVTAFAKEGRTFDVVFFDPPYYQDLAKKTLQLLGAYVIVPHHGLVVAQHHKKEPLPEALGELTLFRQSRYGDTFLSYYRRQGEQGNVPKSDLSGDF
jgi:16S rRNA (guanine966-N2)-methyltransferase